LVKFADFAPGDGGDTVLRIARGVIELTRAAEVTAAIAPGASAASAASAASDKGGAA
jgi:hypothetical protein